MKYIEEIENEYELRGSLPVMKVSAIDKFVEWQKKMKPKVVSIQKTGKGLFVVYEK